MKNCCNNSTEANETTTSVWVDPEVATRGWPAMVINTICLMGLVGYAVYVYIMVKHRRTLTNPFYRLSLSMLVSDVINITTEMLYAVPAMLYGEYRMSDTYRIVIGYFSDGSWFWSSSHLAVIGANRLVAVCLYQRYKQWFNTTNTNIAMIVCWIYGFAMVTMMYACGCQYYFTTFSWIFVCPEGLCKQVSLKINQVFSNSLVLWVILAYIIIAVQVRRTSRKVKASGKALDKQQKKEFQLVFQFVVIGVSLTIYELLFWLLPPLMESKSISDYTGLNIMNICLVINSSIHPFMYVFFGSEVKSKLFVTGDNRDAEGEIKKNSIKNATELVNVQNLK